MSTVFKLSCGESASWTVSVLNPDKTVPDLTGAKLWFTVKCRIEDLEPLISKRSQAAGGGSAQYEILTQSGATKGKARIHLVPGDTLTRKPGKYWCDGWYEAPDGKRTQIIQEQEFLIEPTITTSFS